MMLVSRPPEGCLLLQVGRSFPSSHCMLSSCSELAWFTAGAALVIGVTNANKNVSISECKKIDLLGNVNIER
jgi:hypothetical protein